jgi:hypothetical protein
MKGAGTMVKWVIIALLPIILLLVIEEAAEFFWKRYVDGPGEKKDGKWKDRLTQKYKKIRTLIMESKVTVYILNSKFIAFLRKKHNDPSH